MLVRHVVSLWNIGLRLNLANLSCLNCQAANLERDLMGINSHLVQHRQQFHLMTLGCAIAVEVSPMLMKAQTLYGYNPQPRSPVA